MSLQVCNYPYVVSCESYGLSTAKSYHWLCGLQPWLTAMKVYITAIYSILQTTDNSIKINLLFDLIEVLLQLLICEIDTQLFKAATQEESV